MNASPTSREAGSRRFEFRECLGRGGFGEVYRAVMFSPGGLTSDVAVKILRNADPDAVRRLRDEGRLLATLRHPVILRVHDLALLDGNVALVTEYVEGADVATCIGPDKLSPRAIIEVVGAVADALHAARTTPPPDGGEMLNLVHRDIKPSNIRLGRHGEVKLLDFGIAWSQTPDREALTRGGSTVGSLPYMAPERFGRGASIAASDVYALGATLFEGVVADRLYPDAVPVEMYQRAASQDRHDAFVAERCARVHDDRLRALVSSMLAFAPAQRPDAGEVARACERLAEELPGVRLRTWLRDQKWGGATDLTGGLTGRVVSEQLAFSSAERAVGTPMGVPRAIAASGDTIDIDHLPEVPTGATATFGATLDALPTAPIAILPPVAPPAPEPFRAAYLVPGLALAAVVAVACVLYLLWPPATPVAAIPEVPPVIVAPFAAPEVPPIVVAPPTPALVEPAVPEPVVAEPVRVVETRVARSTKVAKVEPVVAEPVVAKPEPVVVAEPEPVVEAPSEPGTVRVIGEAVIELRSGSRSLPAGRVPPGSWQVWMTVDGVPTQITTIDVPSGGTVGLRCNALKITCVRE